MFFDVSGYPSGIYDATEDTGKDDEDGGNAAEPYKECTAEGENELGEGEVEGAGGGDARNEDEGDDGRADAGESTDNVGIFLKTVKEDGNGKDDAE